MNRVRILGRPAALFTLAAATVLAVVLALVRTQTFAAHSDVAAWGVTFDLTVTIPLLWYLFVVRGGAAKPLTLAPLFVGCTAVAALVVPRGQQLFLHQLRFLAAPLEVVTLVLIARRVAVMRRSGPAPAGSEEKIERAVGALLGDGPVARLVSSEIAILDYAFTGWTRQPEIPAEATPLTVHERSEWGSVVACILVLLAAESLGLHLLLRSWSGKAAWIAAVLDVYGALWLIGDYHALRLRPTLIRPDSLEIRHGLRWRVTIARQAIAAVERLPAGAGWNRRTTLKLALLDEPRYIIRLREPAVAHGVAGIRRTIDSIALLPDDPTSFEHEFGLVP